MGDQEQNILLRWLGDASQLKQEAQVVKATLAEVDQASRGKVAQRADELKGFFQSTGSSEEEASTAAAKMALDEYRAASQQATEEILTGAQANTTYASTLKEILDAADAARAQLAAIADAAQSASPRVKELAATFEA